MANEILIGGIVTLATAAVLVYSMYYIWEFEEERPTEEIIPD